MRKLMPERRKMKAARKWTCWEPKPACGVGRCGTAVRWVLLAVRTTAAPHRQIEGLGETINHHAHRIGADVMIRVASRTRELRYPCVRAADAKPYEPHEAHLAARS